MTVTQRSLPSAAGTIDVLDVTVRDISVSLLSLGAAIHSVQVPDRRGVLGDVHLSLPAIEDYANPRLNPHLGATVGRYANRIARGRFPLEGRECLLDVNAPPNTLHGGHRGFDRLPWRVADVTESVDRAVVAFAVHSPDGDMGFPGAMDAFVQYDVTPGRIEITMRAVTDASTVVSLANHGYWNLEGSATIGGHDLQIHAGRRLATDDTGIPVSVVRVDGTPYDLREARRLGDVLESTTGLDDCYLIDGAGMRVAARLQATSCGRSLTVSSDAPGLQAYSGNSLKAPFGMHQSISLEAQRLPDAPNQPELGPCVLRPGEEYRATTLLEFTVSPS